MLKIQQKSLAKLKVYNKLQMLHLKLASKLAENLVAIGVANYLLNKTNLQKIIDTIIWPTDENEKQLIKEIDAMVQRRLSELNPLTTELKKLIKQYNGSDILTLKSTLSITTSNCLIITTVEYDDCDTALTYSNLEAELKNMYTHAYNPLRPLADFVILLAYPFSSKSIRSVSITDDFYRQSYPCTKSYELYIYHEVKRVQRLKPLRISIVAALIYAILYVLSNVIDRTRGISDFGSNKVLLTILYSLRVSASCSPK